MEFFSDILSCYRNHCEHSTCCLLMTHQHSEFSCHNYHITWVLLSLWLDLKLHVVLKNILNVLNAVPINRILHSDSLLYRYSHHDRFFLGSHTSQFLSAGSSFCQNIVFSKKNNRERFSEDKRVESKRTSISSKLGV